MALIRCPICMQRISNIVEICPECDYRFTPEEIAKNHARNKKTKEVKIGLLFICAFFAITFIVASLITRESTTSGTQRDQLKSSAGTSTYSSQPEPSKTIKTQPPSAPVMSAPTQQEQIAENDAWLGTWSLESIGSRSTGQHLAGSLQSDIFVSWNWTFFADGQFDSKLIQDTGQGIITTTASGTYQVSGDMYETMLNEAIMSMDETSVPIPNVTSHQIGTWSRTGETLSIIPAGSPTKVFKRIY